MALSSSAGGLAQASHAARSTSPSALATRKVISLEVLDANVMNLASSTVPTLSLRWIAILRPKSLEDHLVGEARRALPVGFTAHRPSQQRHAANIAPRKRHPGRQTFSLIA